MIVLYLYLKLSLIMVYKWCSNGAEHRHERPNIVNKLEQFFFFAGEADFR